MTDTNLSSEARLREAVAMAFYEAEQHKPHKEGYCDKCGFCHCEVGHVLAIAQQNVEAALASYPTSDSPLREQLAGLRDGWRESYAVAKANGAYGDNLVRAESCARHADLLDTLIAAYPAGVEPGEPPFPPDQQFLAEDAFDTVTPVEVARPNSLIRLVNDWKFQIALRQNSQDNYQCGVRRGLEMAISDLGELDEF